MHLYTRFTVAVIAALAACLATGCSGSSGPASSPSARAGAARAAGPAEARVPVPASVPGHYVTLDGAHPGRLLVRGTVTGAVTATVSAPAHFLFDAVHGTGTGRVFIIDGYPNPTPPAGGDHLYLLRLNSGGKPLPLVPVPAGHAAGPGLSALALSPDASKIAIAYMFLTSPPARQPLIVYSVKTGAVLRTWTTASGIISGADPMGAAAPGRAPPCAGRRTARNSRSPSTPTRNPARTATATSSPRPSGCRTPWSPRPAAACSPAARCSPAPRLHPRIRHRDAVPGAGRVEHLRQRRGPHLRGPVGHPRRAAPGEPAVRAVPGQDRTGQVNLGFLRQYWLPSGGGGGGPVYGPCTADTPADIQLDWANSDATLVLGGLKLPGHSLFGLFSGGKITALPAPPAGRPATSAAW